MRQLFRTYDVTLTVQSALHIGDGTRLVRDVDWVYEQGSAHVIDVDRALDLMDRMELDRARDGAIARALGQARRAEVTKAVLPVFRFGSDAEPHEVLALIRDPDGRPYVPGSSIKGAIRTALLRTLLRALPATRGLLQSVRAGGRSPASQLEDEHLRILAPPGRSAEPQNRDLLRLVRVSDFRPMRNVEAAFVPVTVRRVDDGRAVLTVWAESVLRGSRFRGTISLDLGLASELRAPAELLERLQEEIRADTEHFLREAEDWAGAPYGDWVPHASGNCLAVLGWGTGWLAHTIGPLVPASERRPLARQLRLGRQAPDNVPFPRSVKVGTVDSALFGGRPGTPFAVPMGVVSLQFRERA